MKTCISHTCVVRTEIAVNEIRYFVFQPIRERTGIPLSKASNPGIPLSRGQLHVTGDGYVEALQRKLLLVEEEVEQKQKTIDKLKAVIADNKIQINRDIKRQ